ncbi:MULTISPECIES: hypothetical protein [unclassified Nitratiruptor]|uniref:hypothetical protein n=1 Tax=unclassified Nitratiruptor TaxID=2624044 RepID=UPI001916AAB6|nr:MULTISPECIES: hypothetical protein [unclassified Nitratiruptor]BCD60327.1 hypothetical protein NitYY0810_C1092 [Nitratiruptor sp. YY08-10]BCD64184.1 hypothetical protein NitYY0814_C1029 [Nitratiruptor sp. YY08-14]
MTNNIERLHKLVENFVSYEKLRRENSRKLRSLFQELQIDQKVNNLDTLLSFSAINVTGFSLQEDSFLAIHPKRYIQIIGIASGKNVNLRYFGRSEQVDEHLREKIAEFVLRWRLEKSFLGVDRYKNLLKRVES